MTYAYLGSISESEPPANSDVSNTSNRALRNDEVYNRDVSEKEMAIYQNNSLLEYPIYGLDMIGKIKDDELHFYLKDHLGSIRATIYDNKLMSAQDGACTRMLLAGIMIGCYFEKTTKSFHDYHFLYVLQFTINFQIIKIHT